MKVVAETTPREPEQGEEPPAVPLVPEDTWPVLALGPARWRAPESACVLA